MASHRFSLIEVSALGELVRDLSTLEKFPTARLPDEFVLYARFTFDWIPFQNGFHYWGESTLDHTGAALAGQIFRQWREIFSAGPPVLNFTMGHVYDFDAVESSEDPARSRPIKEERWSTTRDTLCAALETLAGFTDQAEKGTHIVLHGGV